MTLEPSSEPGHVAGRVVAGQLVLAVDGASTRFMAARDQMRQIAGSTTIPDQGYARTVACAVSDPGFQREWRDDLLTIAFASAPDPTSAEVFPTTPFPVKLAGLLAGLPDLHPDISDWLVRFALAKTPTPLDPDHRDSILNTVVASRHGYRHRVVYPHTLEYLYRQHGGFVTEIVDKPSCPEWILAEACAGAHGGWVAMIAAANPACPDDVAEAFLERACMSRDGWLRRAAADHARCPEHARNAAALLTLANGPELFI